MAMTTELLPVSERALVQRINRKLKAEHENWQTLRIVRGRAAELGRYGYHDGNTWHFLNDLEDFARKLGVLAEVEKSRRAPRNLGNTEHVGRAIEAWGRHCEKHGLGFAQPSKESALWEFDGKQYVRLVSSRKREYGGQTTAVYLVTKKDAVRLYADFEHGTANPDEGLDIELVGAWAAQDKAA